MPSVPHHRPETLCERDKVSFAFALLGLVKYSLSFTQTREEWISLVFLFTLTPLVLPKQTGRFMIPKCVSSSATERRKLSVFLLSHIKNVLREIYCRQSTRKVKGRTRVFLPCLNISCISRLHVGSVTCHGR